MTLDKRDERLRIELIRLAKTLKGRDRTPTEKQVAEESKAAGGDKWDYFMVFGIQPETQAYIDETIRQLENAHDYGTLATAHVRLGFSFDDLGTPEHRARNASRLKKWQEKHQKEVDALMEQEQS